MPIELTPIEPSEVVGYYSSQSEVQFMIGQINAVAASNADNNTLAFDVIRGQYAITQGDIWFNRKLRAAGLESPLSQSSQDFPIVRQIVTKWNCGFMNIPHEPQKTLSGGNVGLLHPLQDEANEEADVMLHPLNRGQFDGQPTSTAQTGPSVVCEQRHGRWGYPWGSGPFWG